MPATALLIIDVQVAIVTGAYRETEVLSAIATSRAAISRGYDVILAADAHTTGDAVTKAATVIQHHNYALGNLAHPDRRIEVTPSDGISFL
jgi:nicotinamidase-related amidase